MLATTTTPKRPEGRRCAHCFSAIAASKRFANYCSPFCFSKALEAARSGHGSTQLVPEFRTKRQAKLAHRVLEEKPLVDSRPFATRPARDAKPMLSTGVSGACGELAVSVDLLRRGYEVFRAVSPACSCDLVALKDGKSYRVEVRTSQAGAPKPTAKDAGRFDIFAACTGSAMTIQYSPEVDGYIN